MPSPRWSSAWGVALLFVVGGQDSTAELVLRSTPKGARVIVDDIDTGEVTPHLLHPTRGRELRIRFEKPGYAPASVRVEATDPQHKIHVDLEPAGK